MRRKPGTLLDNTLLRYLLSFLLVLLLPLVTFFLIYNRYFLSLYQNEVFERYQNEIVSLDREIVTHVQWMRNIAGQFTNQRTFRQEDIIEDAPGYSRTMNVLSSIVSPQDFFTTISFYSSASPDTVYTNNGTFNVRFYKQYYLPDGTSADLKRILPEITDERWFTPGQQLMSSGFQGLSYDCIIPIPHTPGDYVIFSVPEHSFRRLANNTDFMILYGKEDVLYSSFVPDPLLTEQISVSSEPFVRLPDGRVLFCRSSPESGMYLALLLPEEVILSPVQEAQRLFLVLFLLLAAVGGFLVFVMAMFNYRPIRRLSESARRRVSDIPRELQGTRAVGYALESMERQTSSLRRSVLRERAIFKLIYGRMQDDPSVSECLQLAELPPNEQSYCTVVLQTVGAVPKEAVMETVTHILEALCPVSGMEYITGKCYLFLLGYARNREKLRQALTESCALITEQTGQAVRITVGKGYSNPRKLNHSFRQALSLHESMAEGPDICFYEEAGLEKEDFTYPTLDLQSLYYALVQTDPERYQLIADTLMDTVQNGSLQPFTACSICCDIINISLTGMRELQPCSLKLQEVYSSLRWETDPVLLLETAKTITRQALELLTQLAQPEEDAPDSAMQIIRYINENYSREDMNVSQVAQVFGLSVSNLSHRFKSQTGMNISDYISEKRLDYARQLLTGTRLTISEIALSLGYSQAPNFIRKFKAQTGMTPSEYRSVYMNPATAKKKGLKTNEQKTKPDTDHD